MNTRVIVIPLPGLGTLELPHDVFEQHLVRPQAAPQTAEQLIDADELARRTGIPSSWWMAQARERRVPFRKIGRYVRFDAAEALACEAFKRRAIPAGTIGSQNRNGGANA